ncbi:MAG: T9SS C-terminal target domain-containing protein [Calditrichaeota bacterium]|nr:MAG: T9SS C-terminal target domain-containing protein [Calditrichota bacterium]
MRVVRTFLIFSIQFIISQALWGQNWVVEDFEIQTNGLGDYAGLWGSANVATRWAFDPSGSSTGVMEMVCNTGGDKNLNAAFGTEYINIIVAGDTATDWSIDVWVPNDFPTDGFLKIFGQSQATARLESKIVQTTDLSIGGWTTISFDIAKQVNTFENFDISKGLTIGVEFNFKYGTIWNGSVYGDNVTLVGLHDPMAGFELRPPVIAVEHMQNQVSPYNAEEIIYHNKITWENLPKGGTEKYHLYASKQNPIVNTFANDVIQLSPTSGFDRGVQEFRHWLHSKNSDGQTWYYAITAAGIDPVTREHRETEVGGDGNAGPIASATARPHVIPLVSGFNFNPDGNLSEFVAIGQQYSGSILQNEVAEGPAAEEWNSSSNDANFSMYVIMDNQHIYVGAEVIDDNPNGIGDVWLGDAIDLFIGFFNPDFILEYDSQPTFQVGYAINAPTAADRVQVGGFSRNQVANTSHDVHFKDNSYVVEMKIPFSSIGPASRFIPQDGDFIPLRITVNDNDGEDDHGGGRSLMLTHGGGDTENWNAALLPQTWRWHLISSTPDNASSVGKEEIIVPEKSGLLGNYPNPFNPATTISYVLSADQNVKITIYDALGRDIFHLVNEQQSAGEHHKIWRGVDSKGRQVATGIYFIQFITDGVSEVRKMLLTK